MNLATLRNIGIIAHIDAGKTTFSERVLFYSHVIHRMGEVHEGAATMDFLPEEQERGITIAAACITCLWNGFTINLVDTPGHVDFTVEVERSLRVLDAAVGLFCAVGGVEPQSETVWRQAEAFGIPKLAVINKLDRQGASYTAVFEAIQARLGAHPVPVTIPLGLGDEFCGVLDIITEEAILFDSESKGEALMRRPFTPEEADSAAPWRDRLIDALTALDDTLLEVCLAGDKPTSASLLAVLAKATRERLLVPVFAASALRNIGIQPVLDAICALLPSPLEIPPVKGFAVKRGGKTEQENSQQNQALNSEITGKNLSQENAAVATGEPVFIAPDPAAALCALVFKVVMERGRKLAFLRLYSGTLREGDQLANVNLGGHERVSRLFRLHASRHEQLDVAFAGDIVAVQGLKKVRTGDTLVSGARQILLEPLRQWRPVISLAFEPKNTEEGVILDEALSAITAEDPTIQVVLDEGAGQRIVSGMGELHLEVIGERIFREYGIKPRVGNPQVVCRETIRGKGTGESIFARELGGQSHHGDVAVEVRPAQRESGITTRLECETALLPPALVQNALLGIADTVSVGPTGYPVDDVEVIVTRLGRKEGLSTPIGFRIAAQQAVRLAFENAGSLLLEPLMQVDITVPDTFLGAVISVLGTRAARVEAVDDLADLKHVRAVAAMRGLFGFATSLRSVTQGRAGVVMQFLRFDAL